MKLQQIFCPSCGGKISGDLSGNSVYCPYCGTTLYIDHEKNEIAITKNININQNSTITKRHIDETKIAYMDYKLKEQRQNRIDFLIGMGIMLALIIFCGIMSIIS